MLLLIMFLGEKESLTKNCSSVLENLGNRALKMKSTENEEVKGRWATGKSGDKFWGIKGRALGEERLPALVNGERNPSRGSVGSEVVCPSTTLTRDSLETPALETETHSACCLNVARLHWLISKVTLSSCC